MLRIRNKSIPMLLITVVVLCIFCGLGMSHWLTSTHAAQPPQQPYYVVDAYETPAAVYRITNREPNILFKRDSGTIVSFALRNGRFYFCPINDKRIFQRSRQHERVVFEHNMYVRDVAVDPNGNLYFSEASNDEGDGRIYQLTPSVDELGPEQKFTILNEKDPIRVRLNTVDEFWAGDFTFGPEGTLYLSSGNRIPAFIYSIRKEKGNKYGRPRRIYKDTRGAIKGIAIDPDNSHFIYYADWEETIQKLNLRHLGRSVEFSFPAMKARREKKPGRDKRHLSDVVFDIRTRR